MTLPGLEDQHRWSLSLLEGFCIFKINYVPYCSKQGANLDGVQESSVKGESMIHQYIQIPRIMEAFLLHSQVIPCALSCRLGEKREKPIKRIGIQEFQSLSSPSFFRFHTAIYNYGLCVSHYTH